jgi:hypothetical protein
MYGQQKKKKKKKDIIIIKFKLNAIHLQWNNFNVHELYPQVSLL